MLSHFLALVLFMYPDFLLQCKDLYVRLIGDYKSAIGVNVSMHPLPRDPKFCKNMDRLAIINIHFRLI